MLVVGLNFLSDVMKHFNAFIQDGNESLLVFHSFNYFANDYLAHSTKDSQLSAETTFNRIRFYEFVNTKKLVEYKIISLNLQGKCTLSRRTYQIYGQSFLLSNTRYFETVSGKINILNEENKVYLCFYGERRNLRISIPKRTVGYIISGVSTKIKSR